MSKLKHFKEFETYDEYETYINGKPMLPNVSFVGENVYYKDGVPTPPTPIITAGMICYADSSNKLKFCTVEEWDSSLGTVQGVVVVPSNHTSDGTARIMCIKDITSAGTESSSNVVMAWGPIGDTGLPNMDKVPTWDNTIGAAIGNNVYGYLPSTSKEGYFTGPTCACDSLTKYQRYYTPYIPSPYLEDGSQNPAYINTVEATTGNSLSDFDGKSNTAVLVGLGSAYTAANACNQYGTTALPAGNWYLPAMGELGYIIPRLNVINVTLQAVGAVQLSDGYYIWSSTEYDKDSASAVDTSTGGVFYFSKYDELNVRAFASVPVSRLSF